MIASFAIGKEPISQTITQVIDPFLVATAKVSVSVSGSVATLPDFTVSGDVPVSLLASGSIISTERFVAGSIPISLTSSFTATSVNTVSGSALLNSLVSGVLTAGNGIIGSSTISLSASGQLETVLRLDGQALLNLTISSSVSVERALIGVINLSLGAVGYLHNHLDVSSLETNAYALNLSTAGHSVYTNYPFISLFKLGSDYYATSSAGLFKLEGTTDNGAIIQWEALGAFSNFGSQSVKAIPDVYINLRTTGDVAIGLLTDEAKERTNYLIPFDEYAGLHNRRVKTHKGIRGNNWQLSISGKAETEVNSTTASIKETKRNIY